MASKPRTSMTDLELCVLGIVWLRGPCSAYAVRCELAESTSSYWSSSAGSIYPVITRLRAAKLIAAKPVSSDGRGKRNLAVTANGERMLRSWLTDLPASIGMAGLDPIRARMNFFAVLKGARQQLAFIDSAIAHTQDSIENEKRKLKILSGVDHMAHLGAFYELEGRKRWLQTVRKLVSRRTFR